MSIRPRRSLLNPELQRPNALNSTPRNKKLLWLDKNENLDPDLIALSHKILLEISPLALASYPEAGELYRKLGKWVAVSPECLLLTPGSDGAIRLIFETFVEQNDVVVHTLPTFSMYPVYCKMFGAKTWLAEYRRTKAGPCLDLETIFKILRNNKPKLLCLPNPDSPTGTVVEPEVLREILSECESAGTVLLLDEAYHPFYEKSGVSWIKTSRNLIITRSFSKAFGVAGLRIGYAIAHPETITLLHKMKPMYEVSTLAVEFMSRMLGKTHEMMQAVKRINEGKKFFVEAMTAFGFDVLPTLGNFVYVACGEKSQIVHDALSNKVYYRKSFDHPCLKGYSRFTVAPKLVMVKVVDLIRQNLENKT